MFKLYLCEFLLPPLGGKDLLLTEYKNQAIWQSHSNEGECYQNSREVGVRSLFWTP